MAQTTGSMTLVLNKVEISTSGWPTGALDISGISTTLDVSGGDLAILQAFTFGTSTPVVAPGNFDRMKLKVSALYSEISGDNFTTLEGIYTAKTPLQVRYSPKGGSTGNFRFTSGTGYLTSEPYPSGDAEGKNFLMFDLNFDVPSITRSTI